ncbi:DUF6308 family protein [Amycolatopsis sp. Hca4]|uniref:DUF6308 family protein n=1 Tax=Amycolatopsis sp. Hca4 TaxID=2742131 RepID=UPI0015910C8D|nr:DUF6308 family protein [Amycolatopsis sp. Hca4]QKV78056.1 hypothetical protein HUT10_32925 [Amycolatopsis sp. Hca4]
MRVDASGLPLADDYMSQHALLDRYVLRDGQAAATDALRRYFNQDAKLPRYTGRWFERFAGGGDRHDIADTVTEADVLALNFLSIADLANVAIDTTITCEAEITELLEQIPANLAMHEAPWTTYAHGSPASRLWWLFKRCGGKDRWVTANKLLARKRPHLLPVYDSQVKAALDAPGSVWACMWTWFQGDPRRAQAIAELRGEAGGIEDISLLRCIDVILWMFATGRTAPLPSAKGAST